MRKLLVLLVGAMLVLTACATNDGTGSFGAGEGGNSVGINVTGQGRVTGKPDTLSLTLGVSVLRPSVDAATRDAAAKAQAIIDALKANGVAEADIQTANYSIWPEYDYSGSSQKLNGYRVNNELRVKIRNLDKAGAVIDAATKAGGNDATVNGLSFSIEDNTELLEMARAAAWADAEAKAKQLAQLSGLSLGKAMSITESISYDSPPIFYERAAADGAGTPIQPGESEVSVVIQVTFSVG